ncbi:transcriptional regulator [Acinetobacter baumannii]|uniref:Transcriptional regulator n=2 Tax=Gammaproteobacteria TaxID=1236 RepID=A0ABM7AG53_YERPU|nr:transcriptional regulator [Yersinia pseudotuberculosis]RLS12029.1 transcriptional regulator [Acinetobacter baumannii]AYW91208.1 transcriptional regulator [Yersinia pseudotuberculosis]AYW95557.1 transcriptional regulator [Yersinia pseudotuberculosis]MBO1632421.1 transcriptional regulator [Yersinia pseudotuberculosis]MBP0072081.1 transcriptional regulator [Yersinia pseudotuberculosis]
MARAGLPIIAGYEVVSDFEFGGGLVALKQRLNNPEAEPQVLPLTPGLIERGSVSLR